MRYEFVGRKTPYAGKTFWEIVGNLKNFGVGRLVKKGFLEPDEAKTPKLSFMKIVKVQPLPPCKFKFEERRVMVWIEEYFDGKKKPLRPFLKTTSLARYQLIPKAEEEQYLQAAEKLEPPKKYFKKYCYCPPIYKRLWEAENYKEKMPRLITQYSENPGFEVILTEEEVKPDICSLHKSNLTVEQIYQEIVRLKKIIKSNTPA